MIIEFQEVDFYKKLFHFTEILLNSNNLTCKTLAGHVCRNVLPISGMDRVLLWSLQTYKILVKQDLVRSLWWLIDQYKKTFLVRLLPWNQRLCSIRNRWEGFIFITGPLLTVICVCKQQQQTWSFSSCRGNPDMLESLIPARKTYRFLSGRCSKPWETDRSCLHHIKDWKASFPFLWTAVFDHLLPALGSFRSMTALLRAALFPSSNISLMSSSTCCTSMYPSGETGSKQAEPSYDINSRLMRKSVLNSQLLLLSRASHFPLGQKSVRMMLTMSPLLTGRLCLRPFVATVTFAWYKTSSCPVIWQKATSQLTS